MPEQIFKSPGFYDREIDLTTRNVQPSGIPASVIGAAQKGRVFVPITIGSFNDFQVKFGNTDMKYPASYGVQKFLDSKFSCTFVRVLGAGSNTNQTDIDNTRTKGVVKNAGFKLSGSAVNGTDLRFQGATQFIVAKHTVTGSEVFGLPIFTDNASFFTTGSSSEVYLVRGVLFAASDTRVMILSASETFAGTLNDFAALDSGATSQTYKKFKLAISSSAGSSWTTTDGVAGVRILTASLNPSSDDYIAKVLNTDPDKFETEKHLLYADFAVDDELATISTTGDVVGVVSGSANTSTTSGDTTLKFRDAFGRFDTRYTTPRTTWFISQPFGQTEHPLFYFEAIDDGQYANRKYKISLANLRASADPRYLYGTFTVLIRDFEDTDLEPRVLEQYPNVNLDSTSDNYIAKVIGDTKVFYNHDVVDPEDRRLIKEGTNPNKSNYVRVVMDQQVERQIVPATALPFGFRGPSFLNTNTVLTDALPTGGISGSLIRLAASGATDQRLLSAIIPPLPYRFKITRGEVSASAAFEGYPGSTELVDSRYYWGVKFERNTLVLNPNVSMEPNSLISSLTKFHGISKLDVLVTSSADSFNSNKFTLARVALSNTTLADVTGSAFQHMREAAYIRNGDVNSSDYTITDTNGSRVTLATLLMKSTSSVDFNRFSDFTKYTTIMYGGWDGTNILDKNASRLNDKATSTETGGGANGSYVPTGFASNQNGTGKLNSSINSYLTAINIVTDALVSQHNLLAIPGIREPFITDEAAVKTTDHAISFYTMDIPYYDFNATRIFDGDTSGYVDIEKTADVFEGRALDNNATAAYFPNVVIEDTSNNNKKITVPASVAALAAFAYNDKVTFPWFAPAGYNRAALSFVSRTQVKVTVPDQNRLDAVHINPIMKFPRSSFVITAQHTLEAQQSALQSINVKRMLLDVKKSVIDVGNLTIWQNFSTSERTELAKRINAICSQVQTRGGLEEYKIICDGSNNTLQDEENKTLNCQIRLRPTRAVEFIAIDFIITSAGVAFV